MSTLRMLPNGMQAARSPAAVALSASPPTCTTLLDASDEVDTAAPPPARAGSPGPEAPSPAGSTPRSIVVSLSSSMRVFCLVERTKDPSTPWLSTPCCLSFRGPRKRYLCFAVSNRTNTTVRGGQSMPWKNSALGRAGREEQGGEARAIFPSCDLLAWATTFFASSL
jgi:hypothetical protein